MNNIIKNSIEYFDFQNNKFDLKNKIFKEKTDKYDLTNSKFIIKNKNDEQEFKYEILFKNDKINNVLTWSWASSDIDKNKTYIARNLLNYGLDLNDDNLIDLKNMLINSKIKYKDNTSFEILISIILFLSKKNYIAFDKEIIYVLF